MTSPRYQTSWRIQHAGGEAARRRSLRARTLSPRPGTSDSTRSGDPARPPMQPRSIDTTARPVNHVAQNLALSGRHRRHAHRHRTIPPPLIRSTRRWPGLWAWIDQRGGPSGPEWSSPHGMDSTSGRGMRLGLDVARRTTRSRHHHPGTAADHWSKPARPPTAWPISEDASSGTTSVLSISHDGAHEHPTPQSEK